MPFDPTLNELSDQQPQPQGLPPPQPTPDWYARDVQHQQQWGMPGVGEQLGDIASKPAALLQGANEWVGQRMMTGMEGRGEDEESIRAATDLAGMFLGGGIAGAERGALGVAGGKLFLKERPLTQMQRSMLDPSSESKEMDLIDESGKVMGRVTGDRLLGDKTLHVGWAGADKGPWSGGISEMFSFMTELQHEFPGIEKIKASRVSGARTGPAHDPTTWGVDEIVIPKHRRITPGTPRDQPPLPGTKNPILEKRDQQFRERNPYERKFTARTQGQNTTSSSPASPTPAPQRRSNDDWADAVLRLFGNR